MQQYVKTGNITQERFDAIINPTNSQGSMSMGISAAIKNTGGGSIEVDLRKQTPLPVGAVAVTSGHNLLSGKIIHVALTERVVQQPTIESIKNGLQAALQKADELECLTLGIPFMGNKLGSFPAKDVAHGMMEIIKAFSQQSLKEITLIAQEKEAVEAFKAEL